MVRHLKLVLNEDVMSFGVTAQDIRAKGADLLLHCLDFELETDHLA